MRPLHCLVVTTLVCSAAGGGVACAYATSVVPGLDEVDPVSAVTAMRGIISEAASNPLFLLLLIGAAVLAVIVGFVATTRLRQPGSGYLLAGGACTLAAGVVTSHSMCHSTSNSIGLTLPTCRLRTQRVNGAPMPIRGCCGTTFDV
jgi:uncharacterized membrane protein